MRSSKNTRRIEVDETVYRWRATGQDELIAVNIWPENGVGALISGSIAYHQAVTVSFSGGHTLSDQLVVTCLDPIDHKLYKFGKLYRARQVLRSLMTDRNTIDEHS